MKLENSINLQIKSGKSKYNLPCIDASEFPALSEGEMSEDQLIYLAATGLWNAPTSAALKNTAKMEPVLASEQHSQHLTITTFTWLYEKPMLDG